MSGSRQEQSSALARFGPHVLFSLAVLVSVAVSLGSGRLGGSPFLAVEALVLLSALAAIRFPDSHVGLVPVLLIGVNWFIAVEDPATPWVLGAAAGVALLHTSLAAVCVAPLGTPWPPALLRLWGQRFGAILAAPALAWLLVALLARRASEPNAFLFFGGLVVLAAGILWFGSAVSQTGERGADTIGDQWKEHQ